MSLEELEVPVQPEEESDEEKYVVIGEEHHRSKITGSGAYVRFINNTERDVDIVWINYGGKYIRYRMLGKGCYVDVNTYNSHLWVAFDYNTKDRLHIDREFVFVPKTLKDYFKENPDKVVPVNEARIPAYITIPVYSLKYAALLAVRNTLITCKEADLLELPKELTEDLKRVIKLRDNLIYTFGRHS